MTKVPRMANRLERWNQNHLEHHFRYVKMSVIKKKRCCVVMEKENTCVSLVEKMLVYTWKTVRRSV